VLESLQRFTGEQEPGSVDDAARNAYRMLYAMLTEDTEK